MQGAAGQRVRRVVLTRGGRIAETIAAVWLLDHGPLGEI